MRQLFGAFLPRQIFALTYRLEHGNGANLFSQRRRKLQGWLFGEKGCFVSFATAISSLSNSPHELSNAILEFISVVKVS